MRKAIASIVAICFLTLSPAWGAEKRAVVQAPLPAEVLHAKKVFLLKGEGLDAALDDVYAALKDWGRFEIVDSPDKAELVFQISLIIHDSGPIVTSNTNFYTGKTTNSTDRVITADLNLVILSSPSKAVLWQTTVHPRGAFRQKTADKNLMDSASQLVKGLRERIGAE